MDFWASLEHKIYYKYGGGVSTALLLDLKQAAKVAGRLDVEMERLHERVVALGTDPTPSLTTSTWTCCRSCQCPVRYWKRSHAAAWRVHTSQTSKGARFAASNRPATAHAQPAEATDPMTGRG